MSTVGRANLKPDAGGPARERSLLRYRTVIYARTVLTGLTGLIYQVVWQKYLSFIVGSEARSVSLAVPPRERRSSKSKAATTAITTK